MYENKHTFIVILFLLLVFSHQQISSLSITFSYHTCLPNIDLIQIQTNFNQTFHFYTKDFRLFLSLTNNNQTIEYRFGYGNFSLPYSASFDYQFQKAIDYYQEIDKWHFVNLTFNDYQSKIFISFNGDETRLIPLIDYPRKNHSINVNVDVLVDEKQTNVTCLLPHSGFGNQIQNCSINIKTCEHRICTSSYHAEQYCPLFKIFDCRPFTDLECGLKTIPVRCLQNPCQNRGVCYVDLLRNLTQCVCPSGFAGSQCQYSIDECQSNPCPKHSHCIDLPNSYTCVCDPGWTGRDCSIDIDECQAIQPCKAARTCINLPGSYKCDCFDSFGGQNCEMTLDPCLSEPCLNNATQCHPILESDNVVFRCTCQMGFTGHRCETNINDCEGIICPKENTHCVDGINSFDCQCKENFIRNSQGICVERNPCDSSPCRSNATCYNLNDGEYRCMCPPTYTGSQCENDIDECRVFPSICRNGGTCVNEIGSYRCYCPTRWTGSTCTKQVDYCSSQPCLRNGTCVSKNTGGFECQCLPTFTGDICQDDIDECLSNPCLNNGTCSNYFGGFHCRCLNGYFGNRCEHLPNECQPMNSTLKCSNPNLCIVNDTTKLQEVQRQQQTKFICRNETEKILDRYFQCIDKQSKENCECPRDLISCSNEYHSKQSCPCRNNGTCIWLNSLDYRCYCPLGYTGKDCLIFSTPCSSQPCYNNGTCVSHLNNMTFECQCPKSSRGDYCQELIKSSEMIRTSCQSQPCRNNGQCREINQTFECQCLFNYQGQFCEDKLDLCRTNTNTSLCLNGGTCQVNNQTVQCHCLPGFTGLFCEENINECYTKPCSPHGNCIDLINGYQCQCHADWYGYNCDRHQNVRSQSLILRSTYSSIFRLYESNINLSKILSFRYSFLPIRIQYEFRTTLKTTSLLAIGKRFQQELISNRIVTNFDKKIVLSTFIDDPNQWTMIIIEVYQLWIDVRIGKNSMSQRFYISSPSLEIDLEKQLIFGYLNYTGCVRQIEISYSQAYSILVTDQFIELNSNRTIGCEKTNACERVQCRKNELCTDHWFYHTCQCPSPFSGIRCDQMAPMIVFNQSSLIEVIQPNGIRNFSFFFNTIEENGTLFELISKHVRSSRQIRDINDRKILGRLINGRFHLFVIDNQPKYQQYEIRTKTKLNNGYPHEIQLNLDANQLIIDRIHNQSLIKLTDDVYFKQFQFNPNRTLHGWIQDLRINNQIMPIMNTTEKFNLTMINTNVSSNNPCYPINPCQNRGICLVTNTFNYRCQCDENWFGTNCTQINRCQTNTTENLCPNGFVCRTINDNYQECLAIGTFEGNSSLLIAQIDSDDIDTDEITFRLRANQQTEHLFTIENRNTSTNISIHLLDDKFLIRQETNEFLIELNNQTFDQWTTYNFQWLNQSILVFNNQIINSTFNNVFLPHTQIEIRLGEGFRGCLEYFLLGSNIYIPFYNQTNVKKLENIQINNCTFNDLCRNVRCQHGQCIEEFDRGVCRCQHGWEGDFCEINIDECRQGNNCSKEHSQCIDHLDGFYTCQCHQGFTGEFCETNIDECASNPCANGGLCIDLINGYMCNCTNNYISSNCSISLDETCFSRRNTCQNNGTCLLKSPNLYVDVPETVCQCRDGYSGDRCEYDACSNYTCQNNGTCQRLVHGQAKCLCTNEWYGNECEQDVDECLLTKNICLNNGICKNRPGSFECQCQEYYSGRTCETSHVCLRENPCLNQGHCRADRENYYCDCSSNYMGQHCEYLTCESKPCLNNGTCHLNSEKGFSCNCTNTGYEGERCEIELNECSSNPCRNNGTCIDQINGYICTCPRSFLGYNCDEKKFLAVLGFSYHYVIWPGVAVILLLIIILLSILISRIRESRRSRGTYRPALNENGQSSRVEFSMILKPPPEERLI